MASAWVMCPSHHGRHLHRGDRVEPSPYILVFIGPVLGLDEPRAHRLKGKDPRPSTIVISRA